MFDTRCYVSRCSNLGGAKNFHPTADPLPGGAEWPKFNQLEMVTTFTFSLFGENPCTQSW